MNVLLCVLFVLITLSGCAAHSKDIYLSSQSEDEDLRHINRETGNRTVQLVLRSGRSFQAQGAQVSPDSTFWYDPDSKKEITVPTWNVHRITFKSRKNGAKRGLIIGALIGLPGGTLIIDPQPGAKITVGERIQAALAGGLSGALYGLGIGALIGRQTTYFFHSPP